MLPSIAASAAVGAVNPAAGAWTGAILMGSSAAGNAYQDMLNHGYTQEQAASYGVMVGLSEATLEKVLGGITPLGGGGLSKAATAGLEKVSDVLARFAKSSGGKVLLNAGSEAIEEGVQSILEPYIKAIVTGEEFTADKEEILYSALMGFVTGGVFEGAPAAVNSAVTALSKGNTGTPTTPKNAQGEALMGEQAPSGISDLVDGAIAAANNAPADPIGAAVDSVRNGAAVTNKQAQDILNNTRAITELIRQTGITLPDTAAGRRNAVKQAVETLARQQAAGVVDSAPNTDYDRGNDTGGIIYGTGEEVLSAHGGGIGQNAAGGREKGQGADGYRPGVQGGNGTFGEVAIWSQTAKETLTDHKDNFTEADFVIPEVGSYREQTQRTLKDEYGVTCRIVKKSSWTKKDPAYAEGAVIYICETMEGTDFTDAASHELVHVMKQVRFQPYLDFVSDTPDYVDLRRESAHIILQRVAKHRGIDYFSMDDTQMQTLYDELNAAMYGAYRSGGFGDAADQALVADAFPDLNGYIDALNDIHEQYKAHVGARAATAYLQKKEDVTQVPAEGHTANHETNARSAPASPSSNNSIPQSRPNVNPDDSVGAAPFGFDPNSQLQFRYGNIPEGENPVRPDDMARRDIHGNPISRVARTAKGAEVTPNEFVDLLDRQAAGGMLSYVRITNDAAVQRATEHIMELGWGGALNEWLGNVQHGQTGAQMFATGALLLNNAARAGDRATWLDILSHYQIMGTNTAQGLQAIRILKTLAPSDRLYAIQTSIQQMVRDMHLNTEITIDPELEARYQDAQTERERDEVLGEIQQHVADQIPSTLMDRFTALRYVNMLGNFRTQFRNILGNLTMQGVNALKNSIATGIESIAHRASGGRYQRTRSMTVNRELLQACREDFNGVQDVVMGNARYGDNMEQAHQFARGVQERRRIFRSAPMEGYRRLTNWAMERGDILFSRAAYARSLAGYLQAHGVTDGNLDGVDADLLDEARLFAAREAQEVTFRDHNILSNWVSGAMRHQNTPALLRAVGEGVMPFRRTPANVLVRAEEYSPLGVINSLYYSIQSMRQGTDVTGAQVIDSWAKTLTGSGIFGLGMLLANAGCLVGGADDDEKKDQFDSMNGWQNYALILPDGTNLTIDWASPAAIPLLMGAELMELVRDNDLQMKDIWAALASITEPMLQMSMLQGVNDTLEDVRYSDNSVAQIFINACLNYLTQGLTSSLGGQIERTFEDSRKTTYVDKDSALPDWLQRTLGKASAKIPGWDYNQIPYINAWGEEEENPAWYVNGVYNLLSPSYIEKGASTALTEELNRLNGVQSDINVYPSAPNKMITYSGADHNLSADEYVALAKAQGQTQKQIVEVLINHEEYAALSDEEKAKAIRRAYDYARDTARMEVFVDYPGYSAKWMEGIDGNEAEMILRQTAVGSTEKYADLPISTAAYVDDLLRGLQPENGSTTVRPVQEMEAVVADDKLSAYVDDLLRDIMPDSTEATV